MGRGKKKPTQVDFGDKPSDSEKGANEYTEDAKAALFYDPWNTTELSSNHYRFYH